VAVGRQPEVIRAASYRQVPWKNGGGTSREIAAGDGWRISVASIDRDGWFSDFTGYDRTIVPVEGGGIELTIDGVSQRLQRQYEPFAFRGEGKTCCRLLGGPARDLNVMTLRGRWSHAVSVSRVTGRRLRLAAGALCFAYVLRGSVLEAAAGDTIFIAGPNTLELEHADDDALTCVVSLFPMATPCGH